MELVITGQDSEQLARLKVAHAHHAPGRTKGGGYRVSEVSSADHSAQREEMQRYSQRLLRLMVVGVKPVRRELLDVSFGQAARLGLPQALGQVQQGLRGEHGRETVRTLRLQTNHKLIILCKFLCAVSTLHCTS